MTCTEDIPWVTDEDVLRATEDTFLGDYRIQTMREACKIWPRGEVPEGFHDMVRSDAPTLVISGDLDPVTPSWSGDEAAAHLPNSLHIVVRQGHGPTDNDCAMDVDTAFVELGTVEGLDVSCLEAVDLPPWAAVETEPGG